MPLSLSFSDLPNGDCTLAPGPADSLPGACAANPEITITSAELPPGSQSSQNEGLEDSSSASCSSSSREGSEPRPHPEGETQGPGKPEGCRAATGAGPERLFLQKGVAEALLQEALLQEASELKPVELDTFEGNITKQLVKRLTSAEVPAAAERLLSEGSVSAESEGCRSFLDGSLEDAFNGLFLALEPHKEQYKEFQELNQEVLRLDDILKVSTFAGKLDSFRRQSLKPTVYLK